MWSVRCLPLDDEHERQGSQNPATAGNGSSVWADTLPLGHESVGMTGEAESLRVFRNWCRRRRQRKTDALFALAYAKSGNPRFWDGISTIPKRPDGKSWGDE